MLEFIKWMLGLQVDKEQQNVIEALKRNKEDLRVSPRGGLSKPPRPLTEEEWARFAEVSKRIKEEQEEKARHIITKQSEESNKRIEFDEKLDKYF